MMTIKAGEFWLAEIQYTNGADAKKRPVLILWLDGQDAIVANKKVAALHCRYFLFKS
jgi:mRNA interferase MazF